MSPRPIWLVAVRRGDEDTDRKRRKNYEEQEENYPYKPRSEASE